MHIRNLVTMATAASSKLVVEPAKKHTASMILLHGLGDSAHGWIDVAEQLADALPHVRFVLPSASDKPVTMNGGMSMPSWYDIKNLAAGRSMETCDGLEGSVAEVHALIAEEHVKRGIPHDRIVLGGFSQGGAMSLWTGLQLDHTLAGVVSMSGYMPRAGEFKASERAKDTPVLFCHGTSDPVVQFSWAQAAHKLVKDQGVKNVRFIPYQGMVHTANQKEIEDVYQFMLQTVPKI